MSSGGSDGVSVTGVSGSMDRTTPETRLLGTPISAQYVRVLPLDWTVKQGCDWTFWAAYRTVSSTEA